MVLIAMTRIGGEAMQPVQTPCDRKNIQEIHCGKLTQYNRLGGFGKFHSLFRINSGLENPSS